MDKTIKTLSIVTTLYRSAPYIEEFHARMAKVAEKYFAKNKIQFVFVNDGSPDNSLDVAIDVSKKDSRVEVIELSRNFGHHKAIMTGLAAATGDLVFLIDVDLEEEPEIFEKFMAALDTKTDVVYGVMETRKGGWFERLSGDLFYSTFNQLSETKIPRNLSTLRLMRQKFVSELVKFKETEFVLSGVWELTGFRQKPLKFKKHSTSDTSYNLWRKIKLSLDFLTSFSAKPLFCISLAGIGVTFFSLLFILYIVAQKILFGAPLAGWSSLIASIWLMGGLNLFALGVIGLYISHIFKETKNRPFTIIRAVYKNGEKQK